MQKVSERVAEAIQESPYSKGDIAKKMDVSYHTILRWSKGEKEDFKETEIQSLAEILRVSFEWLMFGRGEKHDDPALNQIKSAVADEGEDYKGLDQTLSGVELKAKSLIQDLQSLIDDLDDLRGSGK